MHILIFFEIITNSNRHSLSNNNLINLSNSSKCSFYFGNFGKKWKNIQMNFYANKRLSLKHPISSWKQFDNYFCLSFKWYRLSETTEKFAKKQIVNNFSVANINKVNNLLKMLHLLIILNEKLWLLFIILFIYYYFNC